MKTHMKTNNERTYFVSKANLPVCCPPADEPLWDQHPRVYLPIEATGKVICPYCSKQYCLKSDLDDAV
jgi:uncharacterized Zn-finger protein